MSGKATESAEASRRASGPKFVASKPKFVASKFSIFQGLGARELATVSPLISWRSFDAGEQVFAEQDLSNEIFLVDAGVFVIIVQSEGGEMAVASFGEGAMFGEMAFFDQRPRSAACMAKEEGAVLVINKEAFTTFQRDHPSASSKILRNMYTVITDRLFNSNSFFSEMMQWGEQARKRSITDTLTDLFNRRYFDEALDTIIFDAMVNGSRFALVMLDIDEFGAINRDFGNESADEYVRVLGCAIKAVFRDGDVAARYGGDEFAVVMPGATAAVARRLCNALCKQVAMCIQQLNSKLRAVSLTVSQGIACFPQHAKTKEDICSAADTALYRAKAEGRNRVVLFDARTSTLSGNRRPTFPPMPPHEMKSDIVSIAKRNKIINNIINAILHRDSFVILGHKDCDEDCLAAGVAFALLLKKCKKEVVICMRMPMGNNFTLLQNIVAYNDIRVLSPLDTNIPACDTIIVCDTAKLELLDIGPALKARINDLSILKIECDHHLGTGSQYIGSKDYCFVQQATSSCELLLWLCMKMRLQHDTLERLHIKQILTRNIALALAFGLLADTDNGRFVARARGKRLYRAASDILDKHLSRSTFDDHKATNIADIIAMNVAQSPAELRIEEYLVNRAERTTHLHYVLLDQVESAHLHHLYAHSLIQNTSRAVADQLAEVSGFFGLVGYVTPGKNPIAQFRLRRSAAYRELDLRTVLDMCAFRDGGGHAGAVGFRFPYTTDKQMDVYVQRVIEMMGEAIADEGEGGGEAKEGQPASAPSESESGGEAKEGQPASAPSESESEAKEGQPASAPGE